MSCLESTKRFLSDAGAFIGHYCLDAAAPLAFPTVAKRVLKSYNGASGRAPHAGLYHCTKKMGRYNPLFLAAVTLQVISRIALPRVAEHTLAHSAAKYGYMCGRAAVASLAVFSLDENVVHRYLAAYWEKLFPGQAIPFTLQLRKKLIQIVVDFPSLPIEQQKMFIEQIQKDIEELLKVQLGCSHEIHLLVSFRNS
jgi:hypothetical protein